MKQDIVCLIKKNKNWRSDAGCIIYQQGKSADYFVLVLEGRVEVTVGKENLTFEGGPFTYFGTQALIQSIGVGEFLLGYVIVSFLFVFLFLLEHFILLNS